MKKLFLLFILGTLFSNAQTYVRSSPRQLIVDGNSLFCRGNGNVEFVGEAPLALYSGLTGSRPPYFNFAISGRTIAQLIAEFSAKVAPTIHSGDVILFNEATNSLQALQNVDSVYNQIIRYRNLVQALGARIVICTCPARGNGYAGFEAARLSLNAMLLANAVQFDGVADTGGQAQYNSVAATASSTYYDPDTVHFKSIGYVQFIQPAIPIIQAFFP